MNYGGEYIYDVLSNDSAVTDIVGTFTDDAGDTWPNIFGSRKVPQDKTSRETINYYISSNFNAALNYFDINFSIDCRAKSEYEAYDLADAVNDALNRKSAAAGGYIYFGTISILLAIPPADDADVYNVPVEINLRRK
ncbi:MAG: hypothetical protein R6T96_01475 [Longimicrobiales bacterium]